MNNRPWWARILIYLVAVTILALASYVAVGWYFGSYPQIPVVSQILPPTVLPAPRRIVPVLTPKPGETATKMAVKKIELKEGGFFYTIVGHFGRPLYYQGDVLRGEFVIDGDQRQTRVRVILTGRTGKINFGTFQGSFAGPESWQLVQTDVVRLSVKELVPVQLRLPYLTPPTAGYDKETQAILDQLAGGGTTIPENFILLPAMVGIIKPE